MQERREESLFTVIEMARIPGKEVLSKRLVHEMQVIKRKNNAHFSYGILLYYDTVSTKSLLGFQIA